MRARVANLIPVSNICFVTLELVFLYEMNHEESMSLMRERWFHSQNVEQIDQTSGFPAYFSFYSESAGCQLDSRL